LFLVFLLSALSPAVAASNGNATDTEAQIDQTENVWDHRPPSRRSCSLLRRSRQELGCARLEGGTQSRRYVSRHMELAETEPQWIR